MPTNRYHASDGSKPTRARAAESSSSCFDVSACGGITEAVQHQQCHTSRYTIGVKAQARVAIRAGIQSTGERTRHTAKRIGNMGVHAAVYTQRGQGRAGLTAKGVAGAAFWPPDKNEAEETTDEGRAICTVD